MILAIDVDYKEDKAFVAGVTFEKWEDSEPDGIYTTELDEIEDYVPGSFYKRELPCILALMKKHDLEPDIIVVDGFVYLDGVEKPGLGKHLFDALDGKIPVVGVAKNRFHGIGEENEVFRGESIKPLYVTSEGLEISEVKDKVKNMHGEFRFPDLLKKVDSFCRMRGETPGEKTQS